MNVQQAIKQKGLVMAFGALAMSGAWQAAAEEVAMGTVVVTATRTEIEEFKAPANISVISRETLENGQYSNLSEALKDVPGVTVLNYGARGANYTANSLLVNGTERVVVLIDGMRANTNGSVSSRFAATELVDMSRIERIEVLKGSASTLYGSDAAGGVINIITRRSDEGQISTSLGYTGGNYGLDKYNLRHAGSKDGFFWSLNAQKRSSGDFKDGEGNEVPEGIKENAYALQFGRKFEDGVSYVQLDYSQYDVDYMRPENLGNKNKTPKYGAKDNNRLGLTYQQKITDNLSNKLSLFRNMNNLKDGFKVPSSSWLMDLETLGVNNQLTYRLGAHVLTGGIDYYDDKIRKYESGSGSSRSSYSGKSISSTAWFIQDEWSFAPGWTLAPGFRVDRHEIYGNQNSPAVSLNFLPNNQTNYYASYKEFFVAPNQYQLYSLAYGNMNLQPETGKTVEAGIKHKFSSTVAGTVNVFKRKTDDAIVYNRTTQKYANVQTEDARGASATLSVVFLKNFTANLGYTYTHIKAQTGENANRNGQLPRDAWNLGLNYTKGTLSLDAAARGIYGREGRKQDTYANKQTGYWLVDIAASYRPYKDVKLFAKLNNVFDRYYTDRTENLDPEKWYAQPGRNFQAGIEYSF